MDLSQNDEKNSSYNESDAPSSPICLLNLHLDKPLHSRTLMATPWNSAWSEVK